MYKLLKFYKEDFDPKQFWESKYASHMAGKSPEEFRQQQFWPILEKYLDKSKKYVDLGCGMGGWILFLREAGYNVEGIDASRHVVQAITEYDPDIPVKVADMTGIPYMDSSIDGALAIGTLDYLEDQVPKALSEVSRTLKPQGIFFLEVPVANLLRRCLYLPLKKIEQVIKDSQGKQATFAHYLFDRKELRNLLQTAGFEVIEEQPHEIPGSDSHYGLWVDWKILRSREPYKLNALGRIVKAISNMISPWIASTGVIMVARKK